MVHLFDSQSRRLYPGSDHQVIDLSDDLDIALSAHDPELLYEAVEAAAVRSRVMCPGEQLLVAA